jgi:hypothetical protein
MSHVHIDLDDLWEPHRELEHPMPQPTRPNRPKYGWPAKGQNPRLVHGVMASNITRDDVVSHLEGNERDPYENWV